MTTYYRRHLYKIYTAAGVYVKTLDAAQVLSEFEVTNQINGGQSDLTLKLDRSFDDFNSDSICTYNNVLRVYEVSNFNPTGVLVYTGYLVSIDPVLDVANEYVELTFFPTISKLKNDLWRTGSVAFAKYFNTPAAYSTSLTGTNNDLTFTAARAGAEGNNISITYIDPGATASLSVVVTGTDIVVNLGYAAGAITTTANLIKSAIASSVPASNLVTVADKAGNDGTGLVTAMTIKHLAGGADLHYDPSLVIKECLDNYIASVTNSLVSYTYGTSLEATGTSIETSFTDMYHLDAIERTADFLPSNWYFYVDKAGVVQVHAQSATADHTFTIGKNIASIKTHKSIEDLENYFVLWNGLAPTESGYLRTLYTDSTSVTAYETHAKKPETEGRVTDQTTFDAKGNRVIALGKDPNVRTTISVAANYDFSTIEPGDVCRIRNYNTGDAVYSDAMLIVRVKVSGDVALLDLAQIHSNVSGLFRAGTITDRVRTLEDQINNLGQSNLLGGGISSSWVTDHSILGWLCTMVFSSTDYNTVAWTSGSIVFSNGDEYAINAGNTGNMAALTYIYLDTAVSLVTLQTTTTGSSAAGPGKILVAVAQNNADTGKLATFQVFGGQGSSQTIVTGQLAANAVTANEIAANTITAAEIAAGTITASRMAIGIGGNLLKNSSFESWSQVSASGDIPTGWTVYSGTDHIDRYPASSKTTAHGNWSIRFMGDGAHATMGLQQDVSNVVKAGRYYILSVYVAQSASTVNGNFLVDLYGTGVNTTGIVANLSDLGTNFNRLTSDAFTLASVPTDLVVRVLSYNTPDNAKNTYVDAIMLTECDANATVSPPYSPEGVTLIDGSMITTGKISNSSGTVTLDLDVSAGALSIQAGADVNFYSWTTCAADTTKMSTLNFYTSDDGSASSPTLQGYIRMYEQDANYQLLIAGYGADTTVRINSEQGDLFTAPTHTFLDDNLAKTCVVFIDDDSCADVTYGLVINQQSADNYAQVWKSSDVNHGETALFETDTYGGVSKYSATAGGLSITGATESTDAIHIVGHCTTGDTTNSTAAVAPITLDAWKKSGTGGAALGANENLVVIKNSTTTRFIFDAEGDGFADGSWGTYSDERIKSDIEVLEGCLAKVLALSPKSYTRHHGKVKDGKFYKDTGSLDRSDVGFIAQEVAAIVPEAVKIPESEDSLHVIYETKLIPYLAGAISEVVARLSKVEKAVK